MMISCSTCALALLAMSLGLFFLEKSGSTILTYFCAAFILTFILGFQLGLGPIAYFIGSGWCNLPELRANYYINLYLFFPYEHRAS